MPACAHSPCWPTPPPGHCNEVAGRTGKQALMPSWFGGGCLGWMIVIIMWCVIAVVFPIVIIGWMIILGGVFAAFGGGGGDG